MDKKDDGDVINYPSDCLLQFKAVERETLIIKGGDRCARNRWEKAPVFN